MLQYAAESLCHPTPRHTPEAVPFSQAPPNKYAPRHLSYETELSNAILPITPPYTPQRPSSPPQLEFEVEKVNGTLATALADSSSKQTSSPGELLELGPGTAGDHTDADRQLSEIFNNATRPAPTNGTRIASALRAVIFPRLAAAQTRDERVNRVLMENLAMELPPEETPCRTQEQLVDCMSFQRLVPSHDDPFQAAKPWLFARFGRRESALSAKQRSLQSQYQSLHDLWQRQCSVLNRQAERAALDNQASVSNRSTRATRRAEVELGGMDPKELSIRNMATIPDMISVTGQSRYTFDDTNHLVENPREYYAPATGIHDWTEVEKTVVLEKYAEFPKQFETISQFLPNKTAAQCIEYYYLHKKAPIVNFRRAVRRFGPKKRGRGAAVAGRQKGNGLLADIRQHDAQANSNLDSAPSTLGRGRRRIAEKSNTATPEPTITRAKRRRAAVDDELDQDSDYSPKKRIRRSNLGPALDAENSPPTCPGSVPLDKMAIHIIKTEPDVASVIVAY
ncbi:hypothetical protein FB45DRAFT_915266 [Roridomyces roridus]|uniref:SANT domain-containing protein n=1 Tax=Roridomyces roridus TaxID=1738132 RepID=A0AAD7BUD1_9AGAR|nr:hypothetical protein FB45DRAFT_915266 [Roridomyces roridus]